MGTDLSFVHEFHRAIGFALTQWQQVETSLHVVAHCCMRTDYAVSSTVFFHIESARSKISLADKLCRRTLPQDHYQRRWLPIKKDAGTCVDFRNCLAHFDAAMVDPEALSDELAGITNYPILLTPNYHALLPDDETAKSICVEGILEQTEVFLELSSRIFSFVPACFPDWKKLTKSLPQGTRHLLASRRNQGSP